MFTANSKVDHSHAINTIVACIRMLHRAIDRKKEVVFNIMDDFGSEHVDYAAALIGSICNLEAEVSRYQCRLDAIAQTILNDQKERETLFVMMMEG